MQFGKKFKRLNLKYAYLLASQINSIVISNNQEEKLEQYIWFYSKKPEEYFLEMLTDNIEKLVKPHKETLLHQLILDFFYMSTKYDVYWFNDDYYNWDFKDIESFILENLVQKLEYYGIEIPDFPSEVIKINKSYENDMIMEDEYLKKIQEYVDGIVSLLSNIEENIVAETFYLLFNDRMFLFNFNKLLIKYINKIDYLKYENIFDGNKVRRCIHIPEWLQKAIYFRDNGVCQKCGKDLTGFTRITEEREVHFDHIIPLEKGGSNDSTNFQLLCSKCNLKKMTKIEAPKYYYQYFW